MASAAESFPGNFLPDGEIVEAGTKASVVMLGRQSLLANCEDQPEFTPSDPNWSNVRDRLANYDPFVPEAAHLRSHQVEAIQNFRSSSLRIIDGVTPNHGMAILHPTGSGKTVTMTEILRTVCGDSTSQSGARALVLIPGHTIKEQTLGSDEEVGAIRTFAPHLSVGEYSGFRKIKDAQVTVMTYQSLPGAMARGDISLLDPSIIVCDEAHHVIDGVWAQCVRKISESRLLLGLTATGSYSESRSVAELFPEVLVHKTMKEGIESGILSDLQGYLYKGKSRISVARHGADYDEQDLFRAIADSEDNYLAAKICAQEVMNGRRGVVSCVPGFDRAHAKIMAEILSNTKVITSEGERTIRAAFVGGETHPDAIRRVMNDYRQGKLDVITYVNLLLEGWDSPESDFTVLLRPTISRVLAEQRIGRTIRSRPGKVATVHEIMYETDGEVLPQVTHLDIMERSVIHQGRSYYALRTDNTRLNNRKWKQGAAHIFDMDGYKLDPEIAGRIADLETVPLKDLRIACGQEAIPFNWLTSHVLATRFDMPAEDVEALLANSGILARTEEIGGAERKFYHPEASAAIAKHLGLEKLPPDYLTLHDLIAHHREYRQYQRIRGSTIFRALEQSGIKRGVFMRDDGSIVKAYPPESLSVPPIVLGETAGEEPEPAEAAAETVKNPVKNLYEWLDSILINPAVERSPERRRQITTAQSCLIKAISSIGQVPATSYGPLVEQINQLGLKPGMQMKNVMTAKKLDFVGLLAAAKSARELMARMQKYAGKGAKSSKFI